MTLRNVARDRMNAGEPAIGLGLRLARTVDIANLAAGAGYDWLFIDCEHGALSVETAQQIAAAALGAGVAPLARVPEGDFALATRLLDGGALGIVMPHVDDAAQARRVVDALKYPPLGHRSVAGGMVHFNFVPTPMREVTETLNALSLVVVMLETRTAIANADAIAAVDGVDVLFIGNGDLSVDLGAPGEHATPAIRDAHARVLAACRAHGKWAGLAGITDPALLAEHLAEGFRLVQAGTDAAFLAAAAAQRATYLREAAKAPTT